MLELNESAPRQPTRAELREQRKADLKKAEQEQYERDLEAIDDLEVLHGDSNIGVRRVAYTPGLPVLLAVRTPKPAEVKRYRSRIKPQDLESATAAAIELQSVCRVYPDDATFAKVLAARPGVDAQLGAKAVELATAASESEGKG